jgi:thymidylate synthase
MPYSVKVIKADTLAEAWEKSVIEMMKNGHERFVQAADYLTSEMDSPFFIMVENPLKEPRLHETTPIQREQAEEYSRQLIFGIGDDKQENSFDYTYHSRLRWYPECEVRADWPNIVREGEVQTTIDKLCDGKCIAKPMDQVQVAIDTLKKDPSRRSIVMINWIPSRDSIKFGPKREKSGSPCIAYIQPQIIDNKLHLFVVMKTNDLFNAWPLNAFGMTELQKYMAEQIGVEVGTYTHFSVSMNIYQDMYDMAKELMKS